MELTDYEQNIFDKFSKVDANGELVIRYGVSYAISPDRPDREQLIATIKKYIDTWGNVEFNPDYTKFRRIERINRLQNKLPKPTPKQVLETLITDK